MNTAQPTILSSLANRLNHGDPITIGSLTIQRASGGDAEEELVQLTCKGETTVQTYTADELDEALTSALQKQQQATEHTPERHQPLIGRPCPPWCVRGLHLDAGTQDECVIHIAEARHIEGICIELRRTEFMDGALEQPFLYVDGTEVSVEAAVRVAAELISAIAEAGAR